MALDPQRLNEIVRPHATVSDRIRALNAAGVPRADIARFLGKRYQHVRNVLEGDAQSGQASFAGVNEAAAPFQRDDHDFIEPRGDGAYRLVLRADGSVLLPKEVLAAFKAEPGHPIMAKLDGDAFTLISAETAMERIRDMVCRIIPPDIDLAESLIADRRAEAAREAADD